MCDSSLKQIFELSVDDPLHMPPKCCGTNYIPLEQVGHLFDRGFRSLWTRRFAEHSARNQLYCPSKRCGALIPPESIYEDRGRERGQCNRCKTKVCVACNGRWHTSRECPVDEGTHQILEPARGQDCHRCYRCKMMVELTEGGSHMTW